MISRIITNHVKEGHRDEYIEVSKAFCAALVANCGCIEAKVFADTESTDVINVEQWPDRETAEVVMKSETFRTFLPQLFPHFAGNETVWMEEK